MQVVQITLITHTYTIDAIGQRVPTNVTTTVYGRKQTVSGAEISEAGIRGIQADCRVDIWAFEYNNATEVEINSVKYSVYRTYEDKSGRIELYLEKRVGA